MLWEAEVCRSGNVVFTLGRCAKLLQYLLNKDYHNSQTVSELY